MFFSIVFIFFLVFLNFHLKNTKFAHKCFPLAFSPTLFLIWWCMFSFERLFIIRIRFAFFSFSSQSISTFLVSVSASESKLISVHRTRSIFFLFSFGWETVMTRLHNWVHVELDVSHKKANFIQFEFEPFYWRFFQSSSAFVSGYKFLEGRKVKIIKNFAVSFLTFKNNSKGWGEAIRLLFCFCVCVCVVI